MKLLQKIIFIFIVLMLATGVVFANEKDMWTEIDFTDEFKAWLELSEEERLNTIQPRPHKMINTNYKTENPIKATHKLGSSLSSSFSLRDYIPENLVIRNQGNTQACWTFASLASLETNLALDNYYNNRTTKVYDFSEMHMLYSTTRAINNSEINTYGLNKGIDVGGNYFISKNYLTSGRGPIKDSDMVFDENLGSRSLSDIEGKEVIARVYDTIEFPEYTINNRTEIINQIKETIKTSGGVEAAIHGASPLSEYYNTDTGALYCDVISSSVATNHDILIIGWDDNYSKTNFSEAHRPNNNGAWIIKNSWGKQLEYTYDQARLMLYNSLTPYEKTQYGINNIYDITDAMVEEAMRNMKFTLSDGKFVLPIGIEGFMYVSYEDAHIYTMVSAIEKSSDTLDYDYIYQYDYLPAIYTEEANMSELYLADVFEKKSSGKEYLNEVSIFADEIYECEVYVNPNGSDKTLANMVKAKLKAGRTETIDVGYHTIEFSEPIEITGNEFVVVVHVKGTRNALAVSFEAPENSSGSMYQYVDVESGKCFYTTSDTATNNDWSDCASALGGDLTIKAFTTKTTSYVPPEDPKPTTPDPTNPDPTNPDPANPDPTNPDPSTQQEAVLTDFSNATATIDSIKAYYFTDSSKKEYMILDLIINNINRSLNNDNSTYYYYISTNANENNITGWVAINESQTSSNKLNFRVDTRDISNYSDTLKDNQLYIYIKEVVNKGTDEKNFTTVGLKLINNKTTEVYKDGVKQTSDTVQKETQGTQDNKSGSTTENTANNTNQTNTTKNDNTVANKNLPNTGKTVHIIILMLVISVTGIVIYKKYTKMDF